MLVETISSRKMELVLLDGEMEIFSYSFTQEENVLLILSANDWALQCSKQNVIVNSFFFAVFSVLAHGPQKFQMAP